MTTSPTAALRARKLAAALRLGKLVAALAVAALLSVGRPLDGFAQTRFNPTFDHFATGFTLEGAHATTACESCHVDGVFQGTPTDCASCHSLGGRIRATAKPIDHVASANYCEDCHRTTAWFPLLEMNHDSVYGSCASCHDNVHGAGKPPDHPVTQLDCAACHRTTAWLPARFDHFGVTADCASCHNGVDATGKDAGHIVTSDFCEDCHSTTAWVPATFDHAAVTPGSCSGCHNGTTATGKGADHFATQIECDSCHGTTAWQPVTFAHVSATYPGDHSAGLSCTDCHTTNAEAVPWPYPAYAPDCAACHAGDYRPDPHENASVSTLRDCAGTCHVSRPEHSVTSREW